MLDDQFQIDSVSSFTSIGQLKTKFSAESAEDARTFDPDLAVKDIAE